MRPATVFYDGDCPLCSAEIDIYRRLDGERALRFVDVARTDASLPSGLDRASALARFHVLGPDGDCLSGAAAFVALWRRLPRLAWLARIASAPGALPVIEFGYRIILPIRPRLARLFLSLRSFAR